MNITVEDDPQPTSQIMLEIEATQGQLIWSDAESQQHQKRKESASPGSKMMGQQSSPLVMTRPQFIRSRFAAERVRALRKKWIYVAKSGGLDFPWDEEKAKPHYTGRRPIEYLTVGAMRKRFTKVGVDKTIWTPEQVNADVESHKEFLLEFWTGPEVAANVAGLGTGLKGRGQEYYTG